MPSRKNRSTNGERTPFTAPLITEVKDTLVRNVISGTQNIGVVGDQSLYCSGGSVTVRPVTSVVIIITTGRHTNT